MISARRFLSTSVLALNRTYMPVHVVSVRRAFCLLWKGTAEVVSVENGAWMAYDFNSWREVCELRVELGEYEESGDWISAVSFVVEVPRIVRILTYDRLPKNAVKFSRRNVFLRDDYRCQYCNRQYGAGRLSLDHVTPRSRGGTMTWDNIVTACLDCNVRKGGRTPAEAGVRLLKNPARPSRNPVLSRQISNEKYECWRTFLR